jgi:hypothetical protein
MRLCTFDECMNHRRKNRLCTVHNEHLEKYGRCFPTKSNGVAKDWRGCDTPECDGIHKANGLCDRCYMADRRKRKREQELASA